MIHLADFAAKFDHFHFQWSKSGAMYVAFHQFEKLTKEEIFPLKEFDILGKERTIHLIRVYDELMPCPNPGDYHRRVGYVYANIPTYFDDKILVYAWLFPTPIERSVS